MKFSEKTAERPTPPCARLASYLAFRKVELRLYFKLFKLVKNQPKTSNVGKRSIGLKALQTFKHSLMINLEVFFHHCSRSPKLISSSKKGLSSQPSTFVALLFCYITTEVVHSALPPVSFHKSGMQASIQNDHRFDSTVYKPTTKKPGYIGLQK
ncbi:hypothetical protein O181_081221 [Austropuccinia psidii MF-1]|uniref:Uncharacterized protein n=1 Tax=Austropuccinia psidii MF-1 TaxID=1389203 RepID=A0A9Q3FQA2_9BASI|nr:hypothetical protein [Austropuccinia psidii MF-1]